MASTLWLLCTLHTSSDSEEWALVQLSSYHADTTPFSKRPIILPISGSWIDPCSACPGHSDLSNMCSLLDTKRIEGLTISDQSHEGNAELPTILSRMEEKEKCLIKG